MAPTLRFRLRQGDPAAFAELFDDTADSLYRFALRALGGDTPTAEDVVSLTFLEAWRLRERLLPDGDSPRPWLFGIATNVLRNTTRSARRHQRALARMRPPPPEPDVADEVVDRLTGADDLARARAALDRLRPAEREVFLLCVWSGFDYAGAAEALGIPVGTVRSRLSRAREKLRGLIEYRKKEPREDRGQEPGGRRSAARSNEGSA